MKKKVLIFSESIVYSGSENVIENILLSTLLNKELDIEFLYSYNSRYHKRFLERANQFGISLDRIHRVRLLTPDADIYGYNLRKQIDLIKIALFFKVILLKILKLSGVSHIFNFFVLKYRFKKIRPDILYINNGGYPASLQCCLAVAIARSLGLKNVMFNINNMATPRVKWYDRYVDEYIGKNVGTFITASFAAQKHVVELRGLPKEKFVRIPNTIFRDHLMCSQSNDSFSYGSNKLIFGSVGLLTERKGYAILIEAVNELVNRRSIENIVFKIIGDGEEKEMLQDMIDKYRLNSVVHLLGFNPKPIELVKEFDVFILPSIRNEDFPYVILEAMVLGKPVIGTYVAGIPEQIENGESGYLVEPGNPIELANAIQKMLLLDSNTKTRMGVRSCEKYFEEFCFDKICEKYLNIFNE